MNARDQIGWTALIRASHNDDLEMVRELLSDNKVDVNATDRLGNTALIIASGMGHVDVVCELRVARS